MASVIITNSLKKEVYKKFKQESIRIFKLMKTLEENPKKGKFLGKIGKISINEMRYKSFRFYFIKEDSNIKIIKKSEMNELLIKFVRMSNKKYQQETINEIREILLKIGPEGL